jgi:hypothetical protein
MKSFHVSIPASLKLDAKSAKRVKLFNQTIANITAAEAELDGLTEQAREPQLQGARVLELADQLKASRLDALRAKLRVAVEGKALLVDLLAIAKAGEQAAQDHHDQVVADAGARLEASGWQPQNRPDLKSRAPEVFKRALLEQGSLTPEATAAKAPIGELKSFAGWLTDTMKEVNRFITDTDQQVSNQLNAILR